MTRPRPDGEAAFLGPTAKGWRVVYALAIVALLAPLPRTAIERWYSDGIYPTLQRWLTPLSNLVPVPLFDAHGGVGPAAGPHGLTRWASVRMARPGFSEAGFRCR